MRLSQRRRVWRLQLYTTDGREQSDLAVHCSVFANSQSAFMVTVF